MAAHLEHGHTRYNGRRWNSPTYNTWVSMKQRCFSEDCDSYPDYGGRGITIQDDWHDFENFLRDMGVRPEGTTLDRIDPNGDYTKENCRWASTKQQALNKRNTVLVEYRGELRPLMELCEQHGVPYQRVWSRIFNHGYDTETALTKPPRSGPKTCTKPKAF